MKKQGIIYVHGIGSQESDFANAMHSEIEKNAGYTIERATCWYAPILSWTHNELLARLDSRDDIDVTRMRKLFVNYAGDLVTYYQSQLIDAYKKLNKLDAVINGEKVEQKDTASIYKEIMRDFTEKYLWLREAVGLNGEITIIAHSMGTIVTLDWLNNNPDEAHNIILMGSPKTLADWGNRYDSIPKFKKNGQFWNFYDADDPIGYPLKILNDLWNGLVDRDIKVNVGGLITSHTAASHAHYWEDNDVTKPIAELLKSQGGSNA